MLKENQKAPSFNLPDQDGNMHKLSNYKGKKVILYFYPRDNTPGCSKEACNFRDINELLNKKNVVVIGVSADNVESHKKFANKFSLPFTLLSDPEKKMIEKYGVWQEKSFMGRKFMGIVRSTFIIDEKSKIAKIFPKVSVMKHTKEVLEAIEEL